MSSLNGVTDLVEVVVVTDADHHIDTTSVVCRVVGDDAVHDLAIGDDDLLVVAGLQHRRQDLDLLNDTGNAGCLDKVTDAIGAEQDDQDARCEIGQRALQGEADSEAGGAKDCDEGGCLDSELADRRDDDDDEEHHAHEIADEGLERLVDFLALHDLA